MRAKNLISVVYTFRELLEAYPVSLSWRDQLKIARILKGNRDIFQGLTGWLNNETESSVFQVFDEILTGGTL